MCDREKQTINEIMKTHEPWTVGVSTKTNGKNFFYPVYYSKLTDLWHGYYKYIHHVFSEDITAIRMGRSKAYYIHDCDGKPLPDDSHVHDYITSVKALRNAKKSKNKTRKKSGNNS